MAHVNELYFFLVILNKPSLSLQNDAVGLKFFFTLHICCVVEYGLASLVASYEFVSVQVVDYTTNISQLLQVLAELGKLLLRYLSGVLMVPLWPLLLEQAGVGPWVAAG